MTALTDAAPSAQLPVAQPRTPRAFTCGCGRPVFFRNSECLACHTPLGYDPGSGRLLPLQPAHSSGSWRESLPDHSGGGVPLPTFLRCSQLDAAAACNWLVDAADGAAGTPALCRCCRLVRVLPDLSQPDNAVFVARTELALRRLVSSLIGMKLPVEPKRPAETALGLSFELLRALPGGPKVVTGHADGLITLDVEEADDATREQRRSALHEPYRTLLGHLRHESGHYYWQRLVDGSEWLQPWRAAFGDERQDYPAALQHHYDNGAPADWGARYVSAYASSHPWEDWAETWAHYLHMADTLDTARSFGLDGERVELSYERYEPDVADEPPPADVALGVQSVRFGGSASAADTAAGDAEFVVLLNGWMELTGVLNELSRSMGVPDFYPFVLSRPAVRKLNFVHRLLSATGRAPRSAATSCAPAAAPMDAPMDAPSGPLVGPARGPTVSPPAVAAA